jgi:hypothetical protein
MKTPFKITDSTTGAITIFCLEDIQFCTNSIEKPNELKGVVVSPNLTLVRLYNGEEYQVEVPISDLYDRIVAVKIEREKSKIW